MEPSTPTRQNERQDRLQAAVAPPPGSSFALASAMVCGGCGTVIEAFEPYPFRCPRAGDGGDHVLRRVLDLDRVEFSRELDEPNPFVRWRALTHAYHLAMANGMTDRAFVELVRGLDDEVARVDGHGFVVTPFVASSALAGRLGSGGAIWVKDETGNVSGSHKARHLFGLLVHLEVVRRLGMTTGTPPPLAIASCGNAALAAAVVAAAGRQRLLVFVPTDAEAAVVDRLRALGAEITVCPREEGVAGDPTYHRLQAAIADGALPFTCQGNENGLAIEGGETLGYEMAAGLGGEGLDHVVVQVGGGALASAVAQGLSEAVAFGVLPAMARVHTVQTAGAWPLARALEKLTGRLPADAGREQYLEAIRYAAAHRSEFMWAWESVPHSLAHGILDDETYDWVALVEAMLLTGGKALVVSEEEIVQANEMGAATTGIDVDPTGSAGLAGLAQLVRRGDIGAKQSAAVLFTGARR